MASIALSLACGGCIVIPGGRAPSEGHVEAATIAALEPGKAERADVLLSLGDPDHRYRNDRVFGYRWSELLALVVFGGPAPGAVGGFDVSETQVLLFEFDDDGRVLRREVVVGVRGQTIDAKIDAWVKSAGSVAR